MSFAEASAVTAGPDHWVGVVPEGWDIFGVTNGGFLMSMATRAMGGLAPGRTLISATGTFLNPAGPGPVTIETTVLKSGKSTSTLRASLRGEDRPLVVVTAVFADPDRDIPERELVMGGPPELPPPDRCLPIEPSREGPLPPPFTGKVDLRLHPDDASAAGGAGSRAASMRGWFRLRDGEELGPHAVVMAADAFPPAIFNTDYQAGWTPTIELSVQVRNPTPRGWLACIFVTRFVTGGMLEEDGEIWDESGALVALSRQLALVPR